MNNTLQLRAGFPFAMMTTTTLMLAAALAAGNARAADAAPGDAQALYQQERAACLAGTTGQARAPCLREAGAALAEARQGQHQGSESEDFESNALARCQPLPDEDRDACEARVHGLGTTSGSVAGGGVLHELVTVETEPAPAAPD